MTDDTRTRDGQHRSHGYRLGQGSGRIIRSTSPLGLPLGIEEAPMAIDQTAARSRRALLAAGLGGLVATVASALGRPDVVRAGSDGDVVLGGSNSTTSTTYLTNSVGGAIVIDATAVGTAVYAYAEAGFGVEAKTKAYAAVYGNSDSADGVDGVSGTSYGVRGSSTSNVGVYGESGSQYGVYGTSTNQVGVYGESTNHPGVVGTSTNSIGVSGTSPNGTGVAGSSGIGVGVNGHSNATNRAGTVGQSDGDSTGVLGISGTPVPDAPAKTGVYGEATQDTAARGVWGKSTTGRGVYGEASSGHGVRGYARTGAAVYGSTIGLKSGLALHTVGRVRLDNSVGLATILSGHNSVTVTPGIDLTATSAVVATLQGSAGATTTVHRVVVDASGDTFTIYLTANATTNVTVAWHIFG
jgi:hypothetical protein